MSDKEALAAVMRRLLTNPQGYVHIGVNEGRRWVTIDGSVNVTPEEQEALARARRS